MNELASQGIREGSIAAYPKPNGRTYHNYVTCGQSTVKRVIYLPLKQKPQVEAENERGLQASKLQAMCDQLDQLLSELHGLRKRGSQTGPWTRGSRYVSRSNPF
ncbi:hypothetical protein [Leptolyngbya sp. FACHB-261]|uniref:hypothetical protein n=1 Tax=Leptolyngbya sp. FACHB-261 TaxID=2692806 RepID=UPI0016891C33|nr:hypothetical protein [Leptolyngbya sp. FACHB-261]MBD2100030.1 hypothetical protein [Leptolyngbya sp. FACHB-261]